MSVIDHLKRSDSQMRYLVLGILVAMSILVLGLWHVQIYSSKRHWQNLRQQSFRTVRIPAARGRIVDRNGLALADNRPSYHINLYLGEIRRQFQDEYKRAKNLVKEQNPNLKFTSKIKSDLGARARYLAASNLVAQLGLTMGKELLLDEKKFTRHYHQQRSLPLPVLKDISQAEAARFLEVSQKPPGFDLDVSPLRQYPFKEVGAHMLGYMRRIAVTGDPEEITAKYKLMDFKGVMGLEGVFDEDLRGKAGIKSVMVNSLGYWQSEDILTPTEPGKNLILTLDMPIQMAAENALRESGKDVRGAVVVMDCRNGDLLAMVSQPSYNPNLFIPGISTTDWNLINDAERRCLSNRASYDIYQPGSIFKIVVGLAILQQPDFDPDEILRTRKYYVMNRRATWNDTAPPGDYDFRRAFKLSSNYYFIHHGLKLGRKPIVEMGTRFHLGEATRLPTLQNHPGSFPTDAFVKKQAARGNPWTDGDTANICIGQGDVHVTPLQMAVMVSAVANGGQVYWPRLVQQLREQAEHGPGTAVKNFPVRLRSRLEVPDSHLRLLREAMRADIEDADGTGRRARIPGMSIGGKTGTAETRNVKTITWFASISPVEAARYTVIVMVEEGKSGGTTCAPIAKKIYEAIRDREASSSSARSLAPIPPHIG